ncbi:hypothetical protein [Bacillus changyiensis]|uniref:hypothetical protein n=1 Tax=Bacillus changyiensis TaxID=3004103 RepID=UPI0022E81660|nr:hypothetical protein [Bacillus changyiensis]MDA1477976.1 hypothetical protein [Bacillus changyiensis]
MIEVKKLLKNKLTYVSLGCLLLIVVGSVWAGLLEYSIESSLTKELYPDYPDAISIIAPHQYWVGLSNSFFLLSIILFFHCLSPFQLLIRSLKSRKVVI